MKQDTKKEQKVISRTKDYSAESPEKIQNEGLSADPEGSAEILLFLEELEKYTRAILSNINDFKEDVNRNYDANYDEYIDKLLNETVKLAVKSEHSVSIMQKIISVLDRIKTRNEAEKNFSEDEFTDEIITSSAKYCIGKDPDFYYFKLPPLTKFDGELNSVQRKMLGDSIKKTLRKIASQIVLSDKFTGPFDEFTIIFVHHIIPDAYQGDTDNFNIKKPIDGINGLLITNDSSSKSHIFQITQTGDTEYTEMYVLEGHAESRDFMARISSKYMVDLLE